MAVTKFIEDGADVAIDGAADMLDQLYEVGKKKSLTHADLGLMQSAALIAIAKVLRDIRDLMIERNA